MMPAKRAHAHERGFPGPSANGGASTPARPSYDATGVAKLALDLSEELLEAIAQRAAELMASTQPEPWIGVEQAAEHLCCPVSRIYRLCSRRAIPFVKEGNRSIFKRSELDLWARAGGAK